jgi:hypothetical protein
MSQNQPTNERSKKFATEPFAKSSEVTTGTPVLSRQKHASRAIEHLAEIRFAQSFLRGELNLDEERAWFDEAVAAVVLPAFLAGMFATQAEYKSVEVDAVRGEKVAGGAKNSAHSTNGKHKSLRDKRLSRIYELHPPKTLAEAFRICAWENLGSEGAIKQTWVRHGKKRDT